MKNLIRFTIILCIIVLVPLFIIRSGSKINQIQSSVSDKPSFKQQIVSPKKPGWRIEDDTLYCDKLNFSIVFPNDWEMTISNDYAIFRRRVGERLSPDLEFFSIGLSLIPNDKDFEFYCNKSIDELPNLSTEYLEHNRGFYLDGEKEIGWVEYSTTKDSNRMKVLSHMLANNNFAITIVGCSRESEFSQFESEFMQAIESIEFY